MKQGAMNRKRMITVIVVLALVLLIIIVAFSLNRMTPNKVVGTWVSSKSVYLEYYGCYASQLLEIRGDGTYTERISSAIDGTQLVYETGVWAIEGNKLMLRGDGRTDGGRTSWNMSFGKLKGGLWTLQK